MFCTTWSLAWLGDSMARRFQASDFHGVFLVNAYYCVGMCHTSSINLNSCMVWSLVGYFHHELTCCNIMMHCLICLDGNESGMIGRLLSHWMPPANTTSGNPNKIRAPNPAMTSGLRRHCHWNNSTYKQLHFCIQPPTKTKVPGLRAPAYQYVDNCILNQCPGCHAKGGISSTILTHGLSVWMIQTDDSKDQWSV